MDQAKVVDVRPLAQIFKGVVLVGADDGRFVGGFAVLVDAAGFQPLDQLDFIGLVGKQFLGRGCAQLSTLELVLLF